MKYKRAMDEWSVNYMCDHQRDPSMIEVENKARELILAFCEENTEYLLDGSLEVPVIKLEDLKKYLSN